MEILYGRHSLSHTEIILGKSLRYTEMGPGTFHLKEFYLLSSGKHQRKHCDILILLFDMNTAG